MRRVAVLALAMALPAGCSGTSTNDGAPTAEPVGSSTHRSRRLPGSPCGDGDHRLTNAAGDFDGDARPAASSSAAPATADRGGSAWSSLRAGAPTRCTGRHPPSAPTTRPDTVRIVHLRVAHVVKYARDLR